MNGSKFITPSKPKILGDKRGKQEKVIDIPYIDFELKEYSKTDLSRALDDWKKDISRAKEFENCSLVNPGNVIVEVFRYEKIREIEGLVDHSGNPLRDAKIKILPYGKILKVHPDSPPYLKVGDIVSISEEIAEVETSQTWLAWNYSQEYEKPTPEVPEPDKFTGLILVWRARSKFVVDKLNPTENDDYTFIRSISEFNVVYK